MTMRLARRTQRIEGGAVGPLRNLTQEGIGAHGLACQLVPVITGKSGIALDTDIAIVRCPIGDLLLVARYDLGGKGHNKEGKDARQWSVARRTKASKLILGNKKKVSTTLGMPCTINPKTNPRKNKTNLMPANATILRRDKNQLQNETSMRCGRESRKGKGKKKSHTGQSLIHRPPVGMQPPFSSSSFVQFHPLPRLTRPSCLSRAPVPRLPRHCNR